MRPSPFCDLSGGRIVGHDAQLGVASPLVNIGCEASGLPFCELCCGCAVVAGFWGGRGFSVLRLKPEALTNNNGSRLGWLRHRMCCKGSFCTELPAVCHELYHGLLAALFFHVFLVGYLVLL